MSYKAKGVYLYNIRLFFLTFFVALFFTSCTKNVNQKTTVTNALLKQPTSQVRFLGQWLNEGKREKLVRDFVRKYEFENQDVQILLKFPEEVYFDRSDQLSNQRFIADIMTKPNPEWDIIRLNNQYTEVLSLCHDPLWAKRNLVDFSTYPEFVRNTKPELLSDEVKRFWGGVIPGPFIEGQYWALFTNKRVAEKMGIEVKQYGMTVDDFIGYIKAADAYNQKNPSDYIVPIFDANDWKTAFSLVFNIYISALNNNEMLFTIGCNDQKFVAWKKTLEVLEELAKYNPFNPDVANISWSNSRFDLINEKCLFYANGAWMYNIWEAEDPQKTMNCYPNEFPTFNQMTIYPSGYLIMWAVLKNSPNKDEAVKFLMAMNTPDIAEMWVQYTKCPTGIKGNLTDVSFGSDQYEAFSAYIQKQYGKNTYNYSEQMAKYICGEQGDQNLYYSEVMSGKMTADEALMKLKAQIKKY